MQLQGLRKSSPRPMPLRLQPCVRSPVFTAGEVPECLTFGEKSV